MGLTNSQFTQPNIIAIRTAVRHTVIGVLDRFRAWMRGARYRICTILPQNSKINKVNPDIENVGSPGIFSESLTFSKFPIKVGRGC
ncbi:MAG: hypothetical protein PWQ17_1846 [Anaerophaga sp.]|jgi:hypothetical protein|nr:hypothetical protein [Anaerophaga sp.]MDN5290888.1 hypothetical protein [Anaerophaga sp.]